MSNWNPMTTCPEGREVLMRIGENIMERKRRGDVCYDALGRVCDSVTHYDGWLPVMEWRTDKAPRTGEWLLVTWSAGQRVKIEWNGVRFVDPDGVRYEETWHAWTYDFPSFVPPPGYPSPSIDEKLRGIAEEAILQAANLPMPYHKLRTCVDEIVEALKKIRIETNEPKST